ncbi:MAG: sulfatase-like hydrolase/transferase [Planctomycetota bacterium]
MRILPATLLLASIGLACSRDEALREENRPRAVLLVTIDTLRADRLGCYGYPLAESRSIDGLAERGVLFENAFSPVPLTLPSHTSLLTGTLPPYHGARSNGGYRAVEELVTLAEVLRERGWRTAAFVSSFVLDSQFGLNQGFETYGDVPQGEMSLTGVYHERSAYETTEAAIGWLKSISPKQPFFLWVHYFEPHTPYSPRGGVPARMIERPYDAEVAAADFELGVLLAHLREAQWLEDTLVVFAADHGESLGEHGEETHGLLTYQSTLRIPLIVAHPSLPQGMRVKGAVSLADVMPTILDLLGIEDPPLPPPARSLAPALRGEALDSEPVYFECLASQLEHGWAPLSGVAYRGYKFIRAPRAELYDLRSDPAETDNLLTREPGTATSLETMLDSILKRNPRPAGFSAPHYALSDEERQKLQALGYAAEASGPAQESRGIDPKDGIEWIKVRDEAWRLYEQGMAAEALALFERVLREDPKSGAFQSYAGAFLISLNRPSEAIEHLRLALEYGMRASGVLFNLGLALEKTEKTTEAEAAYREALDLNPKHLLTILRLADLLARTGRPEEARPWYEKLLGLWKGEPRVTEQLQLKLKALDER